MVKFEISYYRKAEKDMDSLEPEEALRIMDDIKRYLSLDPYPHKTRKRKIHGVMYPLYRLRVNTVNDSYRIFYLIEGSEVVVLRVVRKKDAEKVIRTLRRTL